MPVYDSPYALTSRAESRAQGRAHRATAPRGRLADHSTADRDPVGHLRAQNAGRLPELVPLRMQRMLADPFAFYRGTAGLMAADLADAPSSGILVASCGDAHVSNFGFYASPERRLVFDLNDFDEAAIAPWEWDVKRLITSALIGGRHVGYAEADIERICVSAVATYASVLQRMAGLSAADRYFMHLNIDFARQQMSKAGRRALRRAVEGAQRRTGARALERTTQRDDAGRLRFIGNPPTMVRIDPHEIISEGGQSIPQLFRQYRTSVGVDIDTVLTQYAPTDLARRVVGVGSVGTRCFLQLLEGADDDALVLQVKQADRSVLDEHGSITQTARIADGVAAHGEGFRVVSLQRVLQAVSDPFLGYLRANGRDFYVRQFHDMKGSIELEGLPLDAFDDYVRACAAVLGRAHAQSTTASRVTGYIGRSDAAARAILDWSLAYAELSAADCRAVQAAFADEGP
ncbi:MAG TPA: DUF2252 domain-containing protein [Microbacterium sp.]|nr:DUF2252 domain-containing protein [Microbacterium sp.]